jgi:hypothetical protein
MIREAEKGGTVASVRAAVDRVLDEIQRRGEQSKGSVHTLLKRGGSND